MSVSQWVVLAVVTLLGMSVQSAVGFGFAFFVAPALFAVVSAAEAVTALLALGLTINLAMLYGERRRHVAKRGSVQLVVVGALPGILAGVLLLEALSKTSLQVMVGLLIVGAGLLASRRVPALASGADNGVGDAACGLAAGTLTTATGLNGPPLVLWFSRRGGSPREVRDTVTASLFALNVLGAVAVAVLLGIERSADGLLVFATLLPLVALGHRLGQAAFARFDAERHRQVIVTGVVVAGLSSIALGLA